MVDNGRHLPPEPEPIKMDARSAEDELLTHCVQAARGLPCLAPDQARANVLRLASMMLLHRFPLAAENMLKAADSYLSAHPEALVEPADIVRRGWIIDPSRFRDALSRRLREVSPG